MGDWADDFSIGDFIKKLRMKKRKYKFSEATQKKDKKNCINSKQHNFRPDLFLQAKSRAKGFQKTKVKLTSSYGFNESDC